MSEQSLDPDQALLDRGSAHMYICRAGVMWRIEQIFNSIYFNVYACDPEGHIHEYTIICPPHKQHELACSHGPPNGGPQTEQGQS
jgi:hypothetical protein